MVSWSKKASFIMSIYLYRNNEQGESVDIRMVDWQLSRRANPGSDLAYFFGSSTNPDFRDEHLEDLLRFYQEILSERLVDLGHDRNRYTFDMVMADYKANLPFGFCISRMHFMVIL